MIDDYNKKRIQDAIRAIEPVPKAEKTIWDIAKLMFDKYSKDISVFWSPDYGEIHFEGFDDSENVNVDVKVWNGKT